MSIFCYTLESPSNLNSLSDLKSQIKSTSHYYPSNLSACVSISGCIKAYRLCCDFDLEALKLLCKSSAITILYTPALQSLTIPFHEFPNFPLMSSQSSDFWIIEETGNVFGEDVKKGEVLEKSWKVSVIGENSEITFKCVEGDYFGVMGSIHSHEDLIELHLKVTANFSEGWSSSVWRLHCNNNAFGPWLFLEVNVIN